MGEGEKRKAVLLDDATVRMQKHQKQGRRRPTYNVVRPGAGGARNRVMNVIKSRSTSGMSASSAARPPPPPFQPPPPRGQPPPPRGKSPAAARGRANELIDPIDIDALRSDVVSGAVYHCTPPAPEAIPESFHHHRHYIRSYRPTLVLEARESLRTEWDKAWDAGSGARQCVIEGEPQPRSKGKGSDTDRGWLTVRLRVPLIRRGDFKQGDLVTLTQGKPPATDRIAWAREQAAAGALCCAAIVHRAECVAANQDQSQGWLEVHVQPGCPSLPDHACGGMTLNALCRAADASPVFLVPCGNLITVEREYRALCSVQNFPLLKHILDPTLTKRAETLELPKEFKGKPILRFFTEHFNAQQYDAVFTAASHMVQVEGGKEGGGGGGGGGDQGGRASSSAGQRQDQRQGQASSAAHAGPPSASSPNPSAQFTIVHGPPGTGKTHTIWGILNVLHVVCYQRFYQKLEWALNRNSQKAHEIREYLMRGDEASKGAAKLEDLAPRPKILVCAPSNAAVDEIAGRLVRSGFNNMDCTPYRPNLARVAAPGRAGTSLDGINTKTRCERYLSMTPPHWMELHRRNNAAKQECTRKIKQKVVELRRATNDPNPFLTGQGGGSGGWKVGGAFGGGIGGGPSPLQVRLYSELFKLNESREACDSELERLHIVQELTQRGGGGGGGGHMGNRERARKRIEDSFVREAEIVFTTLSSAASPSLHKLGLTFEAVLIDEAAQANEVQTLQPLQVRI